MFYFWSIRQMKMKSSELCEGKKGKGLKAESVDECYG